MSIVLAIGLNSEPVKYAIVALAAPLWIPFAKALWHTLNDGLREEGGLLGQPPTEEQLVELERRFGPAGAALVSVPKDRGAAHGRSLGGSAARPEPRPAAKSGRAGFR